MPFNFAEKALEVVVEGLGGVAGKAAWAIVPGHWKKNGAALVRDWLNRNEPSYNHDLVRALRLSWIGAVLTILDVTRLDARSLDPREQRATLTFCDELQKVLRDTRSQALRRNRDPGSIGAIDRNLGDVLTGVQEYVGPSGRTDAGDAITHGLAGAVGELLPRYRNAIPDMFLRLAHQGVPTEDHRGRPFGELVFAAFAEILKSPTEYPEARVAFEIANSAELRREIAQVKTSLSAMTQGISTGLSKVVSDTVLGAIRGGDQNFLSSPDLIAFVGNLRNANTELAASVGSAKYHEQLSVVVRDISEILEATREMRVDVNALRIRTSMIHGTQHQHGSHLRLIVLLVIVGPLALASLVTFLAWDSVCGRFPVWMTRSFACEVRAVAPVPAGVPAQVQIHQVPLIAAPRPSDADEAMQKFVITPVSSTHPLRVTIKKGRTEKAGYLQIFACSRSSWHQYFVGETGFAQPPEDYDFREVYKESTVVLLSIVEFAEGDPLTMISSWDLKGQSRLRTPELRKARLTCGDIRGQY